jgi:hypothetical protein
MKLITKIGILIFAVALSFLEFNWMACCSGCVEVISIKPQTNFEIVVYADNNFEQSDVSRSLVRSALIHETPAIMETTQ